jgi:subtilisin family serine protease
MTKRILFSLFSLSFSLAFAQQTKISLSLREKMELSARTSNSFHIGLFVKGNIDEIKGKTEEIGGIFKYAAGDIAAIQIPIDKVSEIASINSVVRIEDNNLKLQPLNDKAIIHNHVDLVHQGWGLPQGYDGAGVVVAVIDVGLEYSHPDFRNPDGSTRLKYFWDQTGFTQDSMKRPQPFNYGVQYIGSQIDTVSVGISDPNSHGTHVTGSACGNGLALNNYKGMAPAADIVFIKLIGSDENNYTSSLVDAVYYAFRCGVYLNKPVVINLSIGDYFGSHDGRDLQAQAIDAILEADSIGKGRVVVAAAGNAGAAPFHLGYNVQTDTTFTWLQYAGHPINLDIWADTADFQNIQFGVAMDRVEPDYQLLGGNGFNTINQYINVLVKDTLWSGSNRLGIIYTSAEILYGSYHIGLTIKPDSIPAAGVNYYWRFMTKGSGRFDAWGFEMVRDGLPSPSVFPLITKYKKPDTDQTIVSSFQCSDKVITVGSYDNRSSYTNSLFQQTVDTTIQPGSLSVFSSHGPTRDGRIKPDITSAGGWVLSCGGQANMDYYFANYPWQVAAGKKHFRSSGTSMSSPMVAGICALYLQQNPAANWQEVKNAVINCATQDNFTGSALPDNLWGHGKINAYSMLQGCLIGIDEAENSPAKFSVYPNPFADYATVDYDLSSLKHSVAELRITDMIGKQIKSISLNTKKNSLTISRNNLQSGVYFCSLVVDGKAVRTNKLVVF